MSLICPFYFLLYQAYVSSVCSQEKLCKTIWDFHVRLLDYVVEDLKFSFNNLIRKVSLIGKSEMSEQFVKSGYLSKLKIQ